MDLYTVWIASALAVKFVVAAVFLMAGLTKVAKVPELAESIRRYEIVPSGVASVAARVLPWVEIGIGLTLVSGVWTLWVGSAAAVMLVVFAAAAISAIRRKLPVHCTCFGLLYVERVGPSTIARDFALIAGLLLAMSAANETPTILEAASDITQPGYATFIAVATSVLVASFAVSLVAGSRQPVVESLGVSE